MESVGSSSSQPPPLRRRRSRPPVQPDGERLIRALRHRLRLLHRADSLFFILGATGNVYTVNLTTTPSCSCPDPSNPCKHILFVLIRVLGVSLDDQSLWRRTLWPSQLHRLLSLPTLAEAMAASYLIERFHFLFFQQKSSSNRFLDSSIEIKDGASCPICLEEMEVMEEGNEGKKIVACRTCRNVVHEECILEWKRRSKKRSISCVLCRARWRFSENQEDKYLNLSAYINEDGDGVDNGVAGCGT
ncbi:hypothetical protein Leryth_008484 [Lithospermum erythrorhizon]|uniref:Ubiquitin-protein ligase n=1 Tax=Lithospermum erythrorhizon TaxID=34254 RepID=A0AAV3PHK2_LITER|nr:hypothetical protein Leryth_008484 [Lithospermum erythrorhizon]